MSTIEGEVVSVDLPFPTTDARKWASEFVRLHGGDEGLMLGWFANAMEHQRGPDAAGVTLASDTDRLRADIAGAIVGLPVEPGRERASYLAALHAAAAAALAATPEPTPALPALDVPRVAQAVANVAKRHGIVKDPPVPLFVSRIFGYSAAPAVMDAEIAAEYARLATTTKPQATEPPNSDQYDVVIPEPRPTPHDQRDPLDYDIEPGWRP